ncbi:MAG: M15 family metallopeptidase [Pseudomonadota bacterium]
MPHTEHENTSLQDFLKNGRLILPERASISKLLGYEVTIEDLINSATQHEEPLQIDIQIQSLIDAYPDHLLAAIPNKIIWNDGTVMIYNDGLKKNLLSLLSDPDLEDQMQKLYPQGPLYVKPAINCDPGRVRCQTFFLKMYGNTKDEVESKLVTIKWMPKSVNKYISITSINGIDKKLTQVSEELDNLPNKLKKYVEQISGTYQWRTVLGTNRLSPHSFGIAIDINSRYGDYWRWNKKKPGYSNHIPYEIVEIFERHGFIWGGKWHHYDTIHFEYRPELLLTAKRHATLKHRLQ